MNTDRLDEELLGLLTGRRGHFRLESGHHGDLWLDLDSLFLRPARLRRFAAALALRFADLAIEAVCGPLVGGAFVAQAVAAELDVEYTIGDTSRTISLPRTVHLVAHRGAWRSLCYPTATRQT